MTDTPIYEKGTLKVVWVEDNPHQIHSCMFSSVQAADTFGQTKGDYIIFRLISQKDMELFSWEILPYGKSNLYLKLVTQYQHHKAGIVKLLEKLL